MFLHWFVSILSPLPLIPSLNVRLFVIIHTYTNRPHTHISHTWLILSDDHDYEMNDDDDSGRGGEGVLIS